ncbi:MAG: hypothetical protein ACRYF4_02200, partial [Janthinobacterium lividum]
MRLRSAALALSLLAAVDMAAHPQQQGVPAQDSAPIIRVDTRLVNVPVNVTDAHGVAVSGLSQDDFIVREDGRERKIAIFEREASTPLSI